VRNLLVQKYLGEKRVNWITTLEEYDLEIKLAKIVKGKGLCKLGVESAYETIEEVEIYLNQDLFEREIYYTTITNEQWYHEIRYYLTHGTTPHYLDPKNKRSLRLRSTQY